MKDTEELTMAALEFLKAERRYEAALAAFAEDAEAKKSDLSLRLVCEFAEASHAWERAEKRLNRAAKKMKVWL